MLDRQQLDSNVSCAAQVGGWRAMYGLALPPAFALLAGMARTLPQSLFMLQGDLARSI